MTETTKTSITVCLPWPDRAMSPNARGHWSKGYKAKARYRRTAYSQAVMAGAGVVRGALAGEHPIPMRVTFVPPDRRRRDWDNMLASIKAGIDGIADALGIDDSRFRLAMEVVEPASSGVGVVQVEVTPCQG